MRAKFLFLSLILMVGLGQGCRASFQNADDKSDLNSEPNAGEGNGEGDDQNKGDGTPGEGDSQPGSGDQNPDLDPTPNPVAGVDVDDTETAGPIDAPDGGKGEPVDPIGGGKGKIYLTVTLPQPSIKMGELKLQAVARLNTTTEPPRVRWSISGPPEQMVIGSIDQNGIYTSPKLIDRSFPITVIATLIADPNIIGTAPLLVLPWDDMNPSKPILTVTTPVDVIKAGENKVPATAHLNTQMTPPNVTWSIVPPASIANPGTIDQNGVYTSPKDTEVEFPITIVATLKSDPSVIGIKAIIVKPKVDPTDPKPTLAVTLPSPEIKAGEEKMQATAKLSTQVEPPSVTWSVMGPAGRSEIGTISASGVYTSPKNSADEFAVVITATLISDTSIVGHANLRVLPNDQIFARCTRGNTVFPILADVYQINSTATKLPNFGNPVEARKITTVCMEKYAVPPRNFSAGFPDVPGLFEWFALSTKTQILIPQDGSYTFYLNSDDGSKLYIDGSLVIENDFLHQAMGPGPEDSPNSGQKEITLQLLKGAHDLRLDYFQGPMHRLALELKWKKPGSSSVEYVPRTSFR